MTDAGTPPSGQVLTVRAGSRQLALPAAEVAEVLRAPRLTRVPHAPAALSGVTSVRGEVVPVVSLARLLGEVAGGEASAASRVVLLGRSPPVALHVDEVTSLGSPSAAQAQPSLGQFIEVQGGTARLLDLDALLRDQFGELGGRREVARASSTTEAVETQEQAAALLAFGLAGQSYALPLEYVREVIAVPREIASLPGADQVMLGVFSWRGALLPAASLRALLGLARAESGAAGRMIIVRIGESSVGLVVDELRAIVRAPESAIGPVPQVLNRGAGEARIEAMLRTGDGRGLIAILAPERLFQEESVAQILKDGRQQQAAGERAASEGGESFLVFRVGAEAYGLPIAAVQEVVNLPERLSRLPRAPSFVAGVMSLRGAVVPLIEQRQRFGVEDSEAGGRRRVIVTQVGDLRAGFIVDDVSEILQVPRERLRATPEITAEARRLFDRIADVEVDGRMVLLVDPQQLLDRAEADLLAGLAQAATADAR
jgi:purine-binding chemotaxis protein CheW